MAVGHDHRSRSGSAHVHASSAHVPPGSAGARHRRRLTAALAVLAAFMLVEVAAAWWTGSLALLSDGAHMFTDVLGIGMALAAIHAAVVASRMARRPGSSDRSGSDHGPQGGGQRTFGLYRLEVLAALANAVLLFVLAGYVVVEAIRRFTDPPPVMSGPMLGVAIGGLVVNLTAFALLRPGAQESLNVRGAYLEVLADTLGSVGAIAAAIVIMTTGWRYADPIVAVAVAAFILPRTTRLAAAAVRILVQAAPKHLDVAAIEAALLNVDGVTEVHDLHVWTLTSGMEVASAHLTVAASASSSGVLAEARGALQDGYGIDHATLQLEPSGEPEACCQSVGW